VGIAPQDETVRQQQDLHCEPSNFIEHFEEQCSMNAHPRIYNRPPFAPSEAIAEEFGRDLYAARMDPSDPDDCFRFLADLYPERLKDVLANADRATYEAGQLYIEAEMRRAG
jgi:hypothetical protein